VFPEHAATILPLRKQGKDEAQRSIRTFYEAVHEGEIAMERCRMVFSGSGGQGVITAAIILAEAAVLYENLIAVQSQSYGPEARGGATRSDVIIADSPIHFPKVLQPNVLVCLTQQSYANYFSLLRPGGLLVTDTHYVKLGKKVDARQVELPMYETVMETIGRPIVFNICMLGAVLGLTKLVRPESIMKVLKTQIPPNFLDINRQALDLGLKLSEGLGD
jgi:2-oxoglutarate ferredoxin oxidoreductase subunit gamma